MMVIFLVMLPNGQQRLIATDSWFAATAIAMERYESFSGIQLLGPLDVMVKSDDDDEEVPEGAQLQ